MADKISHKELLPLAVQIFLCTPATLDSKGDKTSGTAYAQQLAQNFSNFYLELCKGLSRAEAIEIDLEIQ